MQYPQTPNLTFPFTCAFAKLMPLMPSVIVAESLSRSMDLIIGVESETSKRRMNAAKRRRGVIRANIEEGSD